MFASYASTQKAVSKERAEQIALKYFPTPKGFVRVKTVPDVNSWIIKWVNPVENLLIYCVIDASTGAVNNYKLDSFQQSDLKKPSINEEQAHKIAYNYVKKFSTAKIQYIQDAKYANVSKQGINIYCFRFPRVINGIRYIDDGISVDISEKGKLQTYYVVWRKVPSNFPSKHISTSKAWKIFSDKVSIKPAYVRNPNEAKSKYKLVYTIPKYFYVDAVSGQMKNESGEVLDDTYLNMFKKLPQRKNGGIFSFSKPIFINRSSSNTLNEASEILTYRKGQKIVEDFILKTAPDKALYLRPNPSPKMLLSRTKLFEALKYNPIYVYSFTRFVNGIPVKDEGIRVVIDVVSGEVLYYQDNFTTGNNFPLPQNILSVNHIKTILDKSKAFQLSYSKLPMPYGKQATNFNYSLDTNYPDYLDASTGEPYDINAMR